MKKTERLIFDSFLSLFSTRDYSSITITMLCDKAGVGRATFYRHYKDLDDVFDFIVDTFILDFKNEVLPIFISEDYEVKKDKIRQFFQGMSHHRQIQNVLSNNVSLFIEKITKRIADNIIESNTLKDYAFYGRLGFLMGVYRRWDSLGRIESPEEMACFIMDSFSGKQK